VKTKSRGRPSRLAGAAHGTLRMSVQPVPF